MIQNQFKIDPVIEQFLKLMLNIYLIFYINFLKSISDWTIFKINIKYLFDILYGSGKDIINLDKNNMLW